MSCMGVDYCDSCRAITNKNVNCKIGNIHLNSCDLSDIEYCCFNNCQNPSFLNLIKTAKDSLAIVQCKLNIIHIFSRVIENEKHALKRALKVREILVKQCANMSNIICCIVLVYPKIMPNKNQNLIEKIYYDNCIGSGCGNNIKFLEIDTKKNIECKL